MNPPPGAVKIKILEEQNMKKRVLALLLGGLLALSLCACGGENVEKEDTEASAQEEVTQRPPVQRTKTDAFSKGVNSYTAGDLSFSVPAEWTTSNVNGSGMAYFYPLEGNDNGTTAMLGVSYQFSDAPISDPANFKGFLEGMEKNENGTNVNVVSTSQSITRTGLPVSIAKYTATYSGVPMSCDLYCFDGKRGYAVATFGVYTGSKYDYTSDVDSIMASFCLMPETGTQQETKPSVTMGQLNALQKALDYLAYTSFSASSLADQLEYEGFAQDEIDYAVEHCGANWKEQAAKKAQDYMDYSSFSRSGLIDQLLFEGFTQEQAEYGATAVGY